MRFGRWSGSGLDAYRREADGSGGRAGSRQVAPQHLARLTPVSGRSREQPAASLFLTAEDSREHTVLPRLVAAGAEARAGRLPAAAKPMDWSESIRLPDDVGYLRRVGGEDGVPSWSCSTRLWPTCRRRSTPGRISRCVERLAPLAALAQEQETAVLLIAHLNKGRDADPFRRLGGSIALAAAARSLLLLARDPDDPEGAAGARRVLAQAKSNLGQLRAEPRVSDQDSITGETRSRAAYLETDRVRRVSVPPSCLL